MSLAAFSLADGPIGLAVNPPKATKAPPKRRTTALADQKTIAEAR